MNVPRGKKGKKQSGKGKSLKKKKKGVKALGGGGVPFCGNQQLCERGIRGKELKEDG